MSIEEKAKAYDEALEKVRPLYERAKKDDSPIWATYEHLFPQLAESEDERIRKSIIRLLQVGGYMSPEDKEKAYAWLENQPTNEEMLRTLRAEYEKGRAEALKDLPRWKRDDSIEAEQYITVGKNGDRFHYKGHSLLISDLTKLPGFKED